MNITIRQLLDKHPCDEGTEFLKECGSLKKAWTDCKDVDWMIWALNQFNLFNEDTARTFACDCAEHTIHFFEDKYPEDKRPRQTIEFARSLVGKPAAESAARSAAWSAARSAARSAAESAAWSAAWSAARSAARSAAWSAARSAAERERIWQCNRLRQLVDPFRKGGAK